MTQYIVRVHHDPQFAQDDGCESHAFIVDDQDIDPDEDLRSFVLGKAQQVILESWPDCYDHVDWNTLEYKEVSND